ncbi:PKD domain-containing protein [Psychroflexus tropicus]|uniref:PKD domain-containing protein n=1 Tax=Psychroflexus tropicus TaxID=197345 RepID=UPI00036396AA|nr:PKD domain-containing protein [Psychroflexus tropicus]
MKLLKSVFFIIVAIVFSFIQLSCEDNDSGIDFVGFEARFISDIDNRTVTFTNLSTEASSFQWDFGDMGVSLSSDQNPTYTYEEDGTYTVTLTATNANGQTDTFQADVEVELILITNGDFENGSEGWIVGVNDNAPAPVVTENGNSFYQVNITNPDPNQPFLVNLSQKLPITQGETYILTFEAWSDTNRTLIAGIGLSGGDFSNDVRTVNLTDTPQVFELTLSSQEFGAPDARVLFDSNGDAGLVRIDNVSLELL